MSDRTSSLYVGHVRHRRRRSSTNAFRYRTYHALLQVDELPRLDRELAGFGYNRRALVGFRDRDHFGPEDRPVLDKLADWLTEVDVELPGGPVRVLTNLRVLGYVFDPVSWWFCHHEDGSLAFVVAEVHNTFGEQHAYLLDRFERDANGTIRATATKRFHVSPFLPIDDLSYRFVLVPPGERVVAHLDVLDDEGTVFDATQTGRREPLTGARLAWRLLTHPAMTLRTMALIHWQAARLWIQRVPFHRKPAPPAARVTRGTHPEVTA